MAANLSSAHREICRQFGPNSALRFKRFGRYQELTWSEYRRQADGAAAGLMARGILPGDRVALLSENRVEWLVSDHAILSAGAVNVPLHAPLSVPQVAYQLGHSGARAVIVSNQQQADKVLAALDSLPKLEFLVAFDGVAVPDRLQPVTWQGLVHRGWQAGTAAIRAVARREALLNTDSLATIIYTSGTTGNPKGVMLTHGNLLSNAAATHAVSDMDPTDLLLSWLPYSHIYARTVDHYMTTLGGVVVALAESIDTLVTNLSEVQPTRITAVPRFYEKVWSGVESLPAETRARELRRIFGPRMRHLCSGGAPLPKHVGEGFLAAGMLLMEGYGLTESSPVISFNRLTNYRIGTVGLAVPGVEVRIDDDGEVLTRGPHVMRGYWQDDAATADTMTGDWLRTGDLGQIDADGFLSITGRKKDLIITSGGKNISPAELERLLSSDPCIDQAVVYGDGRPYVSAMIIPNLAAVQSLLGDAAANLEISDGYIRSPDIHDFFAERVEKLMQAVSPPERVRKFLLRDRPFQLADDEVTATLKIRRHHILSRCEAELAALYD